MRARETRGARRVIATLAGAQLQRPALRDRRRLAGRRLLIATLPLALLLTLLSASPPVSAAAPPGGERERLSSGEVTVFFHRVDRRPAARVLDVAAARAPVVAAAAGLQSLGPVSIFIASTDDEFAGLTFGGVPDWGAGCAFPQRGVIVLRNPVTVPNPLGMEDVVVHEMAHVAAGRVLGGVRVPRWFHEGIAMTIAGEWRVPRSSQAAGAGASGKLIPLDELGRGFPMGSNEAMLAYSESYFALLYLMEEAGGDTPGDLLASVAAAGSFASAVRSLTGRDPAIFERDAVRSFRRRFGWGALISRWEVGFLLVALVAVAAGLLRIRRSRMRLRQMAVEEAGGPVADPGDGARDSRWS